LHARRLGSISLMGQQNRVPAAFAKQPALGAYS